MIFTVYMFLCALIGLPLSAKIANNKRTRIAYCFFCGAALFLIATLRSTTVGYDSGQYAILFDHIRRYSFENVFIKYHDEPLFYFFFKILSMINSKPNFMFAVIGAVFAIAITVFIYKFSELPFISFIMLIPMQFFPFTLSGCRQAIALSFLFAAFIFIINRNNLKALLTFFVAYFFHNSIIVALPLMLIYLIKDKLVSRVVFVITFILTYIFRLPLLEFITTYIYTDYDILEKEVGGLTTLLMYFGIYLLCIFLVNNFIFQRKTDSILLQETYAQLTNINCANAEKSIYIFLENMVAFGLVIQIFVPLQPNIFRAAMYYQIASILVVPKAITNIPNKILRYVAIVMFFAIMSLLYYKFTYYSAGVNPYYFFWQ